MPMYLKAAFRSKKRGKILRFRVGDDGHSLSFLLTRDEPGRERGYGHPDQKF